LWPDSGPAPFGGRARWTKDISAVKLL
jgi:hypothetical protein